VFTIRYTARMHRLISFAFLAVLATSPAYAQVQILTAGGHWDLLGEGYQLTADSAVDKLGNVYFTDARTNRILKIDLDGTITTWKEGSNGAHGVAFGPDGRLYAGQHDRKRIVAFSSDGTESVITERVGSHHLTVTSRNYIYCNDAPAHKVWLVDASGHQRVVHDGINWPRAVRTSPDESVLVVNDPPTRWVWSFQIQPDGSLTNGRPFYRLETRGEKSETDAGGMAFDSEGFLYVATDIGVQVYDQRGRVIAVINVPGEGAANVFFGGPGLGWLYVTDGNKIWRRPAKRHGAPLDVQPRQPRR
jgi:gluconolactonase